MVMMMMMRAAVVVAEPFAGPGTVLLILKTAPNGYKKERSLTLLQKMEYLIVAHSRDILAVEIAMSPTWLLTSSYAQACAGGVFKLQ